LVEELKEAGYLVVITWSVGCWKVGFNEMVGGHYITKGEPDGEAETAERAICLAYLKVKEAEGGK
jgi:hypothetical protein